MAGDPQNTDPQFHPEIRTPDMVSPAALPGSGEQSTPGGGEQSGTGPTGGPLPPQTPNEGGIIRSQTGEAAARLAGASGIGPGDLGDIDVAPPNGDGTATAEGTPTRVVVREIVETLLLALLVFLAVRASFQNFKVDGESMQPTLHNGQFMIVNKVVFAQVDVGQLSRFIPFLNASPHEKRDVFHGPDRGDIVVLVNPRETDMDLVKRVIGLPGETLQIVDGHVYINDHLLIEPYIKQPWYGSTPKITIPKGEYFVMGDNRTNSLDSRSQQVGLIPRDLMIGKAMISYWPLSRFGLAPNASPKVSDTQTTPKVASTASAGAVGS